MPLFKINSFVLRSCLLMSVLLAFSACFPSRKITTAQPLPEMRAETLIEKMDSAAVHCKTISAKIAATADVNEKSQSFTVNLRMRTDSIIWLSISALGIEAARVVITRDSIKMLDRIDARYTITDYSYLNNLLEIGVDFAMLQELLLGNYFPYFDAKKMRSAYVDEQYYILSTLRKRKLKRAMEEKESMKRIIQDVWLDPLTYHIVKMAIDDNKVAKKLLISRNDFFAAESETGSDSLSIAHHVTLKLEAEKPATIDLQLSKVVVNKTLEFPFNIPDKYERAK